MVFHPRNPHVYGIKPVNCKAALIYVELASNSKTMQQCTFDIVLAKTGGIRQLLILLATVSPIYLIRLMVDV